MRHKLNGIITVYLTLILTIIISLVLVSIESARVNTAGILAERVTRAAMKSVLSEFYRPLYDEYHIFALDIGYDTGVFNTEELKERTIKYVEANLNNEDNRVIMHDPLLDSIKVSDVKTILSDNGKHFQEAAIAYQKYKFVGELAEKLFEMLGLIEETEIAKSVLLKQVETEEKLVVIDESLQELMEVIDGVCFDDNMIKKTLFTKRIKTASQFSKRLLTSSVSSMNAGMNHPELYKSLSGKYVNIMETVEAMITEVKGISLKLYDASELNDRRMYLEDRLQSLRAELSSLIDDINKESLMDSINEIESELSYILEQYSYSDASYKKSKKIIEEASKIILNINSMANTKCMQALNIITSIRGHQKAAEADVMEYKALVDLSKDNISDDLLVGFQDASDRMEGYISADSSSLPINLEEAERILTKQLNITQEVKSKSFSNIPSSREEENSLLEVLYSIRELYHHYPSGLPIIDYTGLNIKNESKNNFFKTVSSFIEEGIGGLVFDKEELSTAIIKGGELPTDYMSIKNDKSLSLNGLLDSFGESSLASIFSMNTLSDVLPMLKSGIEALLQKVLYLSYIDDNFADYMSNDYKSVFMYEKEYLISGNLSDVENINSVVSKILLIRFAMNFLYLITDSTCNSKAMSAATAIIGFTGFPALVSVVKYIILTSWAIEGALVETTAIMKGKKIPLLVNKDSISVAFEEIITMSKSMIQEKADRIKDSHHGAGYNEYLWIFLLMTSNVKLSYRSMDLIQENIKSLYDDNFYMSNCIVSYSVDAKYLLLEKFAAVIHNKQYIFQHNKKMSY